jgi:hypothetical protein
LSVITVGDSGSINDGKVQWATSIGLEALGAHPEVLTDNPAYVAARGAAEMAWLALKMNEKMESRMLVK